MCGLVIFIRIFFIIIAIFLLPSCAKLNISKLETHKRVGDDKLKADEFLLKSRIILSTQWQDREKPRVRGVMYHYVRNGVLTGLKLTGIGPLNSKVFDLLIIDGKLFFYHSEEYVTYILAKDDVISSQTNIDINKIFDEFLEMILPAKDNIKLIACPFEIKSTENNTTKFNCYKSSLSSVIYYYKNGFPCYVLTDYAVIRYDSVDVYADRYFPKGMDIEFKDLPLFLKIDVKEVTIEPLEIKEQIFSYDEFQVRPFVSLATKLSEGISK